MEDPNTDNNQIECAHCGEKLTIELARCPHCGVSVYPEDEYEESPLDDRFADTFNAIATPLHSTLLVLIAWVLAVFLSLVIYIPIRWAITEQPGDFLIRFLVTLAVGAGAFAGGYVCARFARLRRLELGILVGALSLVVTLALLGRDFPDLLRALMSPVTIFGWGAIVLAGYGGAYLATGHVREQMAAELFAFIKDEEQLYQDLLAHLGHDAAITERMIEFERRSAPKASRAELIRMAIKRWERDNRGAYSSDLDG